MAVPLRELTSAHSAKSAYWSRAAPPAAPHRPSSRRRSSARRLCASAAEPSNAEAPVALILEAEGVLLDQHDVHRQAFNDAFSEYGLRQLDRAGECGHRRLNSVPNTCSTRHHLQSRSRRCAARLIARRCERCRCTTTCCAWVTAAGRACSAPSSTRSAGRPRSRRRSRTALWPPSWRARPGGWRRWSPRACRCGQARAGAGRLFWCSARRGRCYPPTGRPACRPLAGRAGAAELVESALQGAALVAVLCSSAEGAPGPSMSEAAVAALGPLAERVRVLTAGSVASSFEGSLEAAKFQARPCGSAGGGRAPALLSRPAALHACRPFRCPVAHALRAARPPSVARALGPPANRRHCCPGLAAGAGALFRAPSMRPGTGATMHAAVSCCLVPARRTQSGRRRPGRWPAGAPVTPARARRR